MAGAAPPDAYRKFMKQSDDGRWYWDDSNDPSKIAEGVKSAGEDDSAPWRQAGAAMSYGAADGLMAAAGADKVARYKPDPSYKAKAEAAFGGKPITDQQAEKLGFPAAVDSGPVSPTAVSMAGIPDTPSGDSQPKPAPGGPAADTQYYVPSKFEPDENFPQAEGPKYVNKGGKVYEVGATGALFPAKGFSHGGKPVITEGPVTAPRSQPMPANEWGGEDVREAKGEWWTDAPGWRDYTKGKAAPGSSMAASMMRSPEEFGTARPPLMPKWPIGTSGPVVSGPSVPADGLGGKLPTNMSPTGPKPVLTQASMPVGKTAPGKPAAGKPAVVAAKEDPKPVPIAKAAPVAAAKAAPEPVVNPNKITGLPSEPGKSLTGLPLYGESPYLYPPEPKEPFRPERVNRLTGLPYEPTRLPPGVGVDERYLYPPEPKPAIGPVNKLTGLPSAPTRLPPGVGIDERLLYPPEPKTSASPMDGGPVNKLTGLPMPARMLPGVGIDPSLIYPPGYEQTAEKPKPSPQKSKTAKATPKKGAK